MEAVWDISKVGRVSSKKKKKNYEYYSIHLPIDMVRSKNIKVGDKFLFRTKADLIMLEKVI
jgi:hypothetical protein